MEQNKTVKKIKVRIAGGYGGRNDIEWLNNQDAVINQFEIVKTVSEADLLVLTGGADIDPAIYEEAKNKRTYINEFRDKDELADLKRAIDLKLPIIGICRGAQMLCAVAGGKLVQHVNAHAGLNHAMSILCGEYKNSNFVINSLHHQMMMPFNLPKNEYDLIATSRHAMSDVYENTSPDDQYDMESEPEVIYFKKINAYAIQCHPEMMNRSSSEWRDVLNFFRSSIRSYFKDLFNTQKEEVKIKSNNPYIYPDYNKSHFEMYLASVDKSDASKEAAMDSTTAGRIDIDKILGSGVEYDVVTGTLKWATPLADNKKSRRGKGLLEQLDEKEFDISLE